MDWGHVLFAAKQGIPGLLVLASMLPIFALAASAGRRLRASSASLSCLAAFPISCLLAGLPGIETSQVGGVIPLAGLAVTVVLLVPSVLALRWRWFGLLHLLTVAAAAYLWFIGALAISHDAT